MFSQHRLKLIFVLFEQRRFLSVDCISTYLQANPKLASKGSAGVYDMVGSVPDWGVIEEFVVEFFNYGLAVA